MTDWHQSPNNLKVETRSYEPADVDRSGSGRLAVPREPKIISLVFDMFICMLLLVVQDRTEYYIRARLQRHLALCAQHLSAQSYMLCTHRTLRPCSITEIGSVGLAV